MKYITLLLTFLLAATAAFAQAKSSPSLPVVGEKYDGTYEGTAKGQRLVLELKTKGGNFEGSLKQGERTYQLTDGTFTEGTLSLGFDQGPKLVAKLQGDKLVGDLIVGTEKVPVELKTVVPAAAATPATPATPTAKFVPDGEWDAVADNNGQPFPFSLTLHVEGEKVTGGSNSQLGEATIKEGTWKDGKLVFQLESPNGIIAMSATVVDGKLTGEFDYAGQLSGKWVAVRKTP